VGSSKRSNLGEKAWEENVRLVRFELMIDFVSPTCISAPTGHHPSTRTRESITENRYAEIEYEHHREVGYEESAVLIKTELKAIFFPGLSFGVIIWAAQFTSDQCLISSGFVGMRSIVFPIIAFIVTPFLLLITGIVSEIIRKREQDTEWAPSIPYKAGFLAMSLAFLLFRIVSSVNQYLPFMAPGILPRLA
jgi:hypothetical protein